MIEKFEQLSENEFAKLKAAVAEITILIAGADGKIDKDEAAWAKKKQFTSYVLFGQKGESSDMVGRELES